jgi:hypothetical protein
VAVVVVVCALLRSAPLLLLSWSYFFEERKWERKNKKARHKPTSQPKPTEQKECVMYSNEVPTPCRDSVLLRE